MQITSCLIENNKYVQFYLTKEEIEHTETEETIQKYRKEKCSVAIFITGKENYPEILKKVIEKQVELSSNVC